MPQSIQQLLSEKRAELTAADRKLADVLLQNPREAAFLSTNEVAGRAEVHPTTAVRLARKLGFSGYPGLRASLQNDLFDESAAAERVRRRIERLGHGQVLQAFVQSEIRALARLPEQVSDRHIERAARAIVRCKRVFLFGAGHSEALVRLLELRLTRGGYGAVTVQGDAREAAAAILQAQRHDVFLMFSFYRVHPRVPKLIAHAREVGATTVLITDIVNPAELPRSDVVLAATRGATGEARSLAVPMALCNTIMLEVSRFDRGRMIRNLERLEHKRAALEQPETPPPASPAVRRQRQSTKRRSS